MVLPKNEDWRKNQLISSQNHLYTDSYLDRQRWCPRVRVVRVVSNYSTKTIYYNCDCCRVENAADSEVLSKTELDVPNLTVHQLRFRPSLRSIFHSLFAQRWLDLERQRTM